MTYVAMVTKGWEL